MSDEVEGVSKDRKCAQAIFDYIKGNFITHPEWDVIEAVVLSHPDDAAAREGMRAIANRLGIQSSEEDIMGSAALNRREGFYEVRKV